LFNNVYNQSSYLSTRVLDFHRQDAQTPTAEGGQMRFDIFQIHAELTYVLSQHQFNLSGRTCL